MSAPRTEAERAAAASTAIARVSVVNIDMPFGQMIWFMLKWSVAAIPAFLILALLGFLGTVVLAGLVSGMAGSRRTTAIDAPADAPIVWTRARQLRGFSYAQTVAALGQPSSQEQGILIYQASNGQELRLRLENDRVVGTNPPNFDLTTIAQSR